MLRFLPAFFPQLAPNANHDRWQQNQNQAPNSSTAHLLVDLSFRDTPSIDQSLAIAVSLIWFRGARCLPVQPASEPQQGTLFFTLPRATIQHSAHVRRARPGLVDLPGQQLQSIPSTTTKLCPNFVKARLSEGHGDGERET